MRKKKPNKTAVDMVIRTIGFSLNDLRGRVSEQLEIMAKATTEDEVMEAKQTILLDWLQLMPMGSCHCYYCELVADNCGFKMCEKCPYAKIHGQCMDDHDSDYAIISDTRHKLQSLVYRVYHVRDHYTLKDDRYKTWRDRKKEVEKE